MLKQYVVLRWDPAGGERRSLEDFLNAEVQPYQQIAALTPMPNGAARIVLEARD